jgi:hypothetical protein
MSEPAIGSYRDADGARHALVVRLTADGGWQVLDRNTDADIAHIVDTLTDGQDGQPQAAAIARDYLTIVSNRAPAAGPVPGKPISEQGGTDADSNRRPHPAPRARVARTAALPRTAR